MVFLSSEYKDSITNEYLPNVLSTNGNFEIPKSPIAFMPSVSNARINSQNDIFTFHGESTNPINQIYEKELPEFIFKIVIKNEDARNQINNDLFNLGIHSEFVFQNLDSLSQRINREWDV